MAQISEAIEFYQRNYDIIGQWVVRPGTKIVLKRGGDLICRFCARRRPEVTFQLEAHAIPEALGNRSITSTYECDDCNQEFGRGIENDLGHWSKPMRTFARIRGKSGVPTLVKGSAGGWRIEYDPKSGFNVRDYEDDPIFKIDETNKVATFMLRRDTFVPVAVLKAFVKVGLTLLPVEEMSNFGQALAWIKERDHRVGFVKDFPIVYTFQPGPMPHDRRRRRRGSPQGGGRRSLFRDSGLAQALENGLKLGQIRRIVAHRRPGGADARDGVGRVERETGRGSGMRLVKSTKLRERGGQIKICRRKISIGLDRPSTPRDRLLVTSEVELRQAHHIHPDISRRIART